MQSNYDPDGFVGKGGYINHERIDTVKLKGSKLVCVLDYRNLSNENRNELEFDGKGLCYAFWNKEMVFAYIT